MLGVIKLFVFVIMVAWIVYLLDRVNYLKIVVNEKERTIQRYKIKVQDIYDIYELDILRKNREIQERTEEIEILQAKLQEERDTHKINMTVRIKPSQVDEVKEYIENLK